MTHPCSLTSRGGGPARRGWLACLALLVGRGMGAVARVPAGSLWDIPGRHGRRGCPVRTPGRRTGMGWVAILDRDVDVRGGAWVRLQSAPAEEAGDGRAALRARRDVGERGGGSRPRGNPRVWAVSSPGRPAEKARAEPSRRSRPSDWPSATWSQVRPGDPRAVRRRNRRGHLSPGREFGHRRERAGGRADPASRCLAGSVNADAGLLRIRTRRGASDNTVARIVKLVEEAACLPRPDAALRGAVRRMVDARRDGRRHRRHPGTHRCCSAGTGGPGPTAVWRSCSSRARARW